jgi:hypothetical protein
MINMLGASSLRLVRTWLGVVALVKVITLMANHVAIKNWFDALNIIYSAAGLMTDSLNV